jgi:hypothetical protein
MNYAPARFGEIARVALADADRDSIAFESFIRENSPATTKRLVRGGENLAHVIDALLGAINAVVPHIEPSMAGDLAAARVLADAARRIQERNEAETLQAESSRSG